MNVKAVSKDYLLGGGEDFQFTSIAVAVDGNDTIAIMGTSDGSLMKVRFFSPYLLQIM